MKLQEVMRQTIKRQGKSPKTFETYWQWVEDYLQFLKRTNSGEWLHPKDCGRDEIEDWLTWLANYRHVAKSSQNTALQSVLYLYREILGITIENVSAMRSQQAKRVREVISVEEVTRLFEQLDGASLLASQLIYGCGLRK